MTNLADGAKEESIGGEGHLLYRCGWLAVPQLDPLRQPILGTGRHPVIVQEELDTAVNLRTVPHLYELAPGQKS